MGKSTVIENLLDYDISNGYSVIFIDPKGDSADRIYYHHRNNNKVRYVSFENPIIVNLFNKKGYDLETLIEEFIQIMDNVIIATTSNPESTVRMREIIYQTIIALKPEDRNFQTIYYFLSNKQFRKDYHFENNESKIWWDDLFNSSKTDYKKRADFELTMSGVASRIHQIIRTSKTRQFIDGDNELDIEQLLTNGESLIININSSNDFSKVFIANLFVGSILSYMSLKRKINPLFVYIDEFDLVASGQFSESLQLGRSSLVGFTLAHLQFSSSKSEAHKRMMNSIIDSIFGAVSNYLVFNTSPKVARTMSEIYNNNLSDFTQLDKFEARLKLGTKKLFITTCKPKLINVPDDYIFPTKLNPVFTDFDFLGDEWIDF
jgi:hypothetical protein